jgi:hypothetical protein
MRGLSHHFNLHHPIDRDSHETDGVLGTQVVRRKTGENLGQGRDSSMGCGQATLISGDG